jgi:hypothetical protein
LGSPSEAASAGSAARAAFFLRRREVGFMDMQMVTPAEKAKLEQDLKRMIDMRLVIAKAIAEAREKGDLKENADYHAAREEYALNESRIKNMEERIRSVTVVDSSRTWCSWAPPCA